MKPESTRTEKIWTIENENQLSPFRIMMQNIRGIPQAKANLKKEDKITKIAREQQIDVLSVMESGIYDKKKPYIPICFNKELHNNRISDDNNKH